MSFGSQPAPLKIDVIIVGAGIAGLATAFALSRTGHRVQIFEKRKGPHERSVGVRVPPNLSKILYEWGLQEELSTAQKCLKSVFLSLETNTPVGILEWQEDVIRETGGDFLLMHYDDIYKMLYKLAVDQGTKILFDMEIKAVFFDEEQEQPAVKLLDGTVHHTDLVVGADGYNSIVREAVTGQPDSFVDTGMSFASVVVPIEKLKEDPDWSQRIGDPVWPIFMGNGRNVLGYPVRNGTEYCLHAYYPDKLIKTDVLTETWDTCIPTSSISHEDAHPSIPRIFSAVPNATHIKYRVRDIVTEWADNSGTIVVIGEAAHALMPCTIHNLALAVEDAALLGVLMSHLSKKSQIRQFLGAFQELRFPRIQQVQASELSNAALTVMPPGVHRDGRDAGFAASLKAAEGHVEWDDEKLRAQWNEISFAFGYDALDAGQDWWHGFGRIAKSSGDVDIELDPPAPLFFTSYHVEIS